MVRHHTRLVIALAASLAAGFLLSLFAGPGGFLHTDSPAMREIFLHVRLPRTIGALLAGAGLSTAGALIQRVFRNPLASPSLIGINAATGFFTVLAGILFPFSFAAGEICGFLGGLAVSLLIVWLVWKRNASKLTVLLAGMAISQLFLAGIDLLTVLVPDALSGYASFKIGSLASLTLKKDLLAAVLVVPGIILSFVFSRQLDLLSMGPVQCEAVGLSVRRWTIVFLALASLMATGIVTLAGMLGFVGLIVPAWLGRFRFPPRLYLFSCVMAGAILVCLADLTGRLLVMPWELPAGLILSLIGGPYFLVLLFERKTENA